MSGEHAGVIKHEETDELTGAAREATDPARAEGATAGEVAGATAFDESDESARALASSEFEREVRVALRLARAAGAEALKFYGGPLKIRHKTEGDDPVTQADYAANRVIVEGITREFADDGLLSEETTDTVRRLAKRRVWVIDPIDGTKGFIEGNGDFAVQIGLAVEGYPALGVVYQPAADLMQWAARGAGAWVVRRETGATRLRVSDVTEPARMRLAASLSHRSPRMDAVVKAFGFTEEVRRGSVGIKIGLIVERQCDLYVTLSSRTHQWDTCAPEAILSEAGGRLTDLFGEPVNYNAEDTRNYNGVAATNGAAHALVVRTLAPLLAEFSRARRA
ncbi:MAG: 3'(2'),5'-bisphosphate nucleotidase CysQ [Pyrinomonadaceae bacterium]